MLFVSSRSGRDKTLKSLYARFADRWHQGVLRLGYIAAYDQLIAYDADRRSSPVGTVLDAGTGTGAFALSFVQKHPTLKRLTLLDMSPEMLAQAEKNLHAKGIKTISCVGGLGTNDIAERSCETILCAHVIEHTNTPKDHLRWFCSRLSPGGTLLLSVSKPHWCTAIVRWRWGHKAYPPSHVTKMLEDAGFEDISEIRFKSGPPSRTSCGYRAKRPA